MENNNIEVGAWAFKQKFSKCESECPNGFFTLVCSTQSTSEFREWPISASSLQM